MARPFSTNNLSLAAYLVFSGFAYTTMEVSDDTCVWTFERSSELDDEVLGYSGGSNEYAEFAGVYNSLRREMHKKINHSASVSASKSDE
jgi:hypothetical protein